MRKYILLCLIIATLCSVILASITMINSRRGTEKYNAIKIEHNSTDQQMELAFSSQLRLIKDLKNTGRTRTNNYPNTDETDQLMNIVANQPPLSDLERCVMYTRALNSLNQEDEQSVRDTLRKNISEVYLKTQTRKPTKQNTTLSEFVEECAESDKKLARMIHTQKPPAMPEALK